MNLAAIQPKPADTSNSPGTPSNGATNPASLNTMFLQLLVAQLKNQSPLDPLDPSQFVGQLAQFSELSEVTSIYQLLQQGMQGVTGTSAASGSSVRPLLTSQAPAHILQGGF